MLVIAQEPPGQPEMLELLAASRAEGVTVLRPETGAGWHAALAPYQRLGFAPCERFDPCPPDVPSVFMEKPL